MPARRKRQLRAKTQPSARRGMRRQAYARIAGRMRASAQLLPCACHNPATLGPKTNRAAAAAPLEKGTPWDFSIYSAEASIKSSNRPALPKTPASSMCAPRRNCRSGHVPGAENVPLDAIGSLQAAPDTPIFVLPKRGAQLAGGTPARKPRVSRRHEPRRHHELSRTGRSRTPKEHP